MKRLIIYLLLFGPLWSVAQVSVPKVWDSRIEDEANILTPEFENRLDLMLKQYQDSTSNQIAVMTIKTLNDYPIEQYALEVAEGFGLGQADKDNGVLLLVVVDDRKIRIEVGEGLEGVLPDAICNQIIRNEIAPRFRQGDYPGGIASAVLAMTKAIGGEYKADQTARPSGRRGGSIWTIVIVLIIIYLISRTRGGGGGNYRRGGWTPGGGWYGGGFGGRGGGFGGGFGGGGFSGGGGGFGGGGSSGSW